jgi:hypothetical protein
MTALTMQKLATALFNEGFVVKKIEDEQKHSFDRSENGEKYTGQIIIVVRSVNDEEAEAEAARLRKEKERAGNEPAASEAALASKEVPF